MSQHDSDSHQREELLKAEIARLRERVERTTDVAHEPVPTGARPTPAVLWLLAILAIVAGGAAFLAGYLPRAAQDRTVVAESKQAAAATLKVNVVEVRRSEPVVQLALPGAIQASTEAPILARADGYLKRRLADIGDHVKQGQLLAEIEAPELDQQTAQAAAALAQATAAREQSAAALDLARANEQLARTTAQRWANLLAKGVVSRQENDTYQAQANAQSANVRAQERSLAAAGSSIEAARANLARLQQIQTYRQVRAPFAGLITLRNVDSGALISSGQTLLYRIAQTGSLRAFVNVPQAYAASIRPGAKASLACSGLAGAPIAASVARSSNALDPASRTLLTEVRLPAQAASVMPGMYCTVTLEFERRGQPLIIAGDTLMIRPSGPTVAVLTPANRVHFQVVKLGRDFGKELEVVAGLSEGQLLVTNPGDQLREGIAVQPNRVKLDARGQQ